MAAPYASAAIGRALSATGATPEGVLSALARSALDLGEPGFDETFGHGLIASD
jgi:hypothetical protein